MKKIKELWAKNRIVFVLVCILIICFLAIIIVASTFFFSGNKSNYGDRLVDISNYEITDEFITTYKDSLTESKLVEDVSFRTSGRIIYVTIKFNSDASLDEAKSIATKSVDVFSEKNLGYYDINFIVKISGAESDAGLVIMGAKNANGSGVVWNNNSKVEESE